MHRVALDYDAATAQQANSPRRQNPGRGELSTKAGSSPSSVDRLGRRLQDLVGALSELSAPKIDPFLRQQGTRREAVRRYEIAKGMRRPRQNLNANPDGSIDL